MDHSRELNTNMNRQYDQFMNLLFNDDKIENSTSIASNDASWVAEFEEFSTSFFKKPTSTPTWKTIQRYEKPSSADFDSMHLRNR